MITLKWEEIKNLADQKATLLTKTSVPFQILSASDDTLTIRVRSGEEYTIRRANLEKAVHLLHTGAVLNGPLDYRNQVADDRPAYAWALLNALGYLR